MKKPKWKKTACKRLQETYQDQNLGLATLKTWLIMPIFRKKKMKLQKKTCKDLQRTYQDQNLGLAPPPKDNFQEESNPNEQITKETIHVLQEQLAVKDKQIDEKDKQIAELTAMLKNSQEQQAALVQALTAAQALAAADKHQLLLQAGQTTEQAVSDNIQTSENTKKGFFQRLFGK